MYKLFISFYCFDGNVLALLTRKHYSCFGRLSLEDEEKRTTPNHILFLLNMLVMCFSCGVLRALHYNVDWKSGI